MSIQQQGFRFYVSEDRKQARWLHELDLSTGHYPQYKDWIDATEMTDQEFESFMMGIRQAGEL